MNFLKLVSGASYFSFFILFEKLYPFLIIPFFTNYIGLEELGKYSLFFVVIEIIFAFTNFSSQEYLLINIKDCNISKFISNSLTMSLIFSACFFLITSILNIFLDFTTFQNILFGFIILFSKSVFNSFYGVFRGNFELSKFSSTIIIVTFFSIVFSFSIGYFLKSSDSVIAALALSNLLSLVFLYFMYFSSYINLYKFDSYLIRKHLEFGLPISFSRLGTWMNQSGNKIIVSFFLDNYTLGLFTSTMIYFSIIEISADSLSKGVIPLLYNNKEKNENIKESKLIHVFYYSVIVLIFLLSFYLTEFIWTSLLSLNDFNIVKNIILIILVSSLFKAFSKLDLSYIYYEKKTIFIFKCYFFTGIINLVLSSVLVNYFLLYGVAYSMLFISIVQFSAIKIKSLRL